MSSPDFRRDPPLNSAAGRSINEAVDALRFEAIEQIADLATSYWRSVAEAAYRREGAVVTLHCRQLAAVTREAFALAKTLGAQPVADDAP